MPRVLCLMSYVQRLTSMKKGIGVKTPQTLAIQKDLPKKKDAKYRVYTRIGNRRKNDSNFGNLERFAKEKRREVSRL